MRNVLNILFICMLTGIVFNSCQTDQATEKEEKPDSSVPSLKSRTSNAKMLTVEDIFLKVPKENFKFDGWDDLDTKYRKKLLEKGNMDALHVEVEDNHLKISEKFANEDDENERSAVLDVFVFRHETENYNVVFVSQSYDFEEEHQQDEVVSQKFWEFDGRNWNPIKEGIPVLETKLFFEDDFELPELKAHHIQLGVSKIDENTLSASLNYAKYEPYGLTPEQMITNETHIVNLIWNGQMFELQRKPHDLN